MVEHELSTIGLKGFWICFFVFKSLACPYIVLCVSVGSSSSSVVQLNIQETNQAPEVNAINTVVEDADRSKAQEVLCKGFSLGKFGTVKEKKKSEK